MKRRALPVLAGSTAILFVALFLGVTFGTGSASLARAVADASSKDHDIVFALRLPRALLAAIAGAGLSVVGVSLQALLRNPLAEPFVLGVSGGSALGATIAIVLGVSSPSVVPLAALAGGMGATALVLAFASRAAGPRAISVLLAGVVVNTIASAAITLVKTIASPGQAYVLLYWLVGFFDVPSDAALTAVAIYVGIGAAVLMYDAGRLNILSLGNEAAQHLGVRVRAVEIRTLVASSLVVGAIVSVTGLIGFVGLVVPHILRRLLGADARMLMPISIVLGGASLVLCDLASRLAVRVVYVEPPVGVITALVGGPLFLFLLLRKPAS